jgi:uncharacterized protein involved in exopolysaccharide biosynthesis
MLETYSAQQSQLYEDQGQSFDFSYIIGVIRRRFLYFTIPFLIVAIAGAVVIKRMPKTYRASGEILVESPRIAPDLVHPTITELADERFAVFKHRIMSGDNLLAVIDKFNLFPRERASLSTSQLLDLMRASVEINPVALAVQSNSPTLQFSVAFDYQVPELALKVTNEFLTQIVSEDASRRADTATETAKFLEEQLQRLKAQHDATVAQIEAVKRRPPDQSQTQSEEIKEQMKTLAALQANLVEKSTIYSDEYPAVKDLKRQIAALKKAIAAAPQVTAAGETDKPDVATQVLQQQEADLEKSLEEANHKLTQARLGESMERNQQAEHLSIIAYPELPDKPVRPNKMKLLGLALGLAGAIGAGAVVLAEMLDGSIRRSSDLAAVIDRHLIVLMPYLQTPNETRNKHRRIVLSCTAVLIVLAAAALGVARLEQGAFSIPELTETNQTH